MNQNKIVKILRIFLVFIIVILGVFLLSIIIQYPDLGKDFSENLGIVSGGICSGTLTVSSSETNKCVVSAEAFISGCDKKNYQIKEQSCLGEIKCEGYVNYKSFQTACAWETSPSSHKYVLCIDKSQKDLETFEC
jgi:hypothetical protein